MNLPQFDPSFFVSQFFWLIVCLLILIYCFKNIFVPRMDETLSKRNEYIQKYIRMAETLDKDIIVASDKVEDLKNRQKEDREEIVRNAIRNSEHIMEDRMRAIRDENEALLNSVRYRLHGEMKSLESTFKIHVNDIAKTVFNKVFLLKNENND